MWQQRCRTFAGRALAARAAPARDTRFVRRYGTFAAFSVSEVTVRGDLRAPRPPRPRRTRSRRRARAPARTVRARLRPAAAAARPSGSRRSHGPPPRWSGEGEAVALDSSTTAYYLALELRSKRELVVVTNGLLIADALADAPGVTVLVTGGVLRLQAMSLVGDVGSEVLRKTRINKGFVGRARSEPRPRADGPQPRRGAAQAGAREGVRACDRGLRRHEVAPERAALVRPRRPGGRDRHGRGRARSGGRGLARARGRGRDGRAGRHAPRCRGASRLRRLPTASAGGL